jgi:predicted nucleic acid-binding protein
LTFAIDTSTMRRLLSGAEGSDVWWAVQMLRGHKAALPPVVVTELLSERSLQTETRAALQESRILLIHDGYWERAGELRADLLAAGFKAKLADCLIAQSCIDNDAPLITYDRDFRHFERAGLRVI